MKCPGCGAEGKGKFCEYCGSALPQEKSAVYVTNNYYNAAPQERSDAGSTAGRCPKCGNSKISFEREWQGGRSQTAYETVGVCQSCGYTWNPNAAVLRPKPRRKTWLWVLGWLFMFPIPLTILLLRKKDMKPIVKYGIIAAAWILCFIIGMSGQ